MSLLRSGEERGRLERRWGFLGLRGGVGGGVSPVMGREGIPRKVGYFTFGFGGGAGAAGFSSTKHIR